MLETTDAQRILHLQRLGGRVERVGHVALHCRARRRIHRNAPAAAADGFIVSPTVSAQAATLLIVPQLAAGIRSGRAVRDSAPKTCIDNALAGLGIPRDHGSRIGRMNQRPWLFVSTWIFLKQPALNGTRSSSRHAKQ